MQSNVFRKSSVKWQSIPRNQNWEVINAPLRFAKVTRKDVIWNLGCGTGRIPAVATNACAYKVSSFEINTEHVKDSPANTRN
ncbi:MAG: hypothetical protein V4719_06420 [Planctomycetota bacterium]